MTEKPTRDELISRIETLEQQQKQLRAEQNQVQSLFQQFKNGQISRRAFMTAVAAIGGVGFITGRSRAAPSWGNSTGNIGTSSTPLANGYIQNLRSQMLNTDDAMVTGELTVNELLSDLNSSIFMEFGDSGAVADTNRVAASNQEPNTSGVLFLTEGADNALPPNVTGIFTLRASNTPVLVGGDTGQFAATKGNQGTVNVYNESGTQWIENETGQDIEPSWAIVGTAF